jgi:tetratricopeptide (TPR) repeat protein
MIVRDEIDVIEGAFESARGVVDEIIVADTGSEDGTADLVRQLGAEVIDHRWQDDFSAARNASLERATGDWILVLDADERLDSAGRTELRARLEGPRDRAYTFRQHTYLEHARAAGLRSCADAPAAYRGYCGYLLARQTRLFPRLAGLSYRGPVHEEITADLERLGLARTDTEIVVHHLGKVRGASRDARKNELYRRLCQAKLESDPSARAHLEAGVSFMKCGDPEQARESFLTAARLAGDEAERAQAIAAASRAMCALGRTEEALDYLRARLPETATVLPVWEALADTLCRSGRHDVAIRVLNQALPLFPEHLQLWWMLSEAYTRLRQPDLAARARERWRRLGGVLPEVATSSSA